MTAPYRAAPRGGPAAGPDLIEPVAPTGGGVRLLRAAGALAPGVALLVYLVFAVRAGLPSAAAARGLLVVLVTQVVPGAVLWRAVRPRRGWVVEDLAMGFGIGIMLAAAAQTVAGSLQQPWIAALLGPAAAAAAMAHPASRSRMLGAGTEPLPWLWGPAVAAVTMLHLVPTQSFYRRVPLAWAEGFRATYVDIPFHHALVGQLAHRGPWEMPFVLGEPLAYHWLSHAWVAQVAVVGGIPLDAVLVRFLPPVITVAAVLCVAAGAVRLSGRAWTGPVAALIALGAGDLDVYGGVRPGALVAHLSPSTGLAVPLIVLLLALLATRWRGERAPGSLALLGLAAFSAAAMKGSALPVVVAGALLAAAVATWRRSSERWRIGTDALVLSAALVAAVVLLFRDGAQGMALDPVGATARYAAHLGMAPEIAETSVAAGAVLAVVTLFGALARGAGLVAGLAERTQRRDPVFWLLLGTGLAGTGAVLVFSHDGNSHWYFLRAATPALAIGSATVLLALLDRVGRRARELVLGGIVLGVVARAAPTVAFGPVRAAESDMAALERAAASLLIFAAVLAIGAAVLAGSRRTAPDRRSSAACVLIVAVLTAATGPVMAAVLHPSPGPEAGPVGPDERFAFSADQIEAARYIRDHSDVHDVVMTNRRCAMPAWENCDSRRFHVAAYTERRVLVEGWAYTPTAGRLSDDRGPVYSPFWDQDRLALNDRFLSRPDAASRSELLELGVRWVFIDKVLGHTVDLGDHATLRLESAWASIYELEPIP